jgi:uncharacterized protein DUF4419
MSLSEKDSGSPSFFPQKQLASSSGFSAGSFPIGLAKVPFRWNYLERFFDMEFLGGFVGVAQDQETLTLRPEIGWAVREASAAG